MFVIIFTIDLDVSCERSDIHQTLNTLRGQPFDILREGGAWLLRLNYFIFFLGDNSNNFLSRCKLNESDKYNQSYDLKAHLK